MGSDYNLDVVADAERRERQAQLKCLQCGRQPATNYSECEEEPLFLCDLCAIDAAQCADGR